MTFQVSTSRDWLVLLIDDDEDEFLLTRDKLIHTHGRKIQLDWASTYSEGLEKLAQKSYDAVLVDYDLGATTGVELIREATERNDSTPLILFTSRGTFEADVEAMRAGATLYLSKDEANPLLLQRSIRYAIERKQAERQLRLVVNATPALMSYIGKDFCYRWMNRNYELWFGRSIENSNGKHVREVLGDAAWDAARPYMERALTGEMVDYIEELPYQDGGPRWVHVTYTPDRDEWGNVQGFVVHAIDVGERIRAGEVMKSNEREFRTFFELSNAGKAVIDIETNRLVRVNRKYCEIHGYSEEELLTMRYRDLTYSEDWERSRKVYDDAVANGSSGWQIEKRCVRKDGQVIWEEVLGAIVRDDSGRAVQNFVVVQDITERKRLEEAVFRYAQELKRSNTELEEFAVVASHDLNEPLRKLELFSQQLLSTGTNLEDSQKDVLQRMNSNAQRMRQMVDGLLELSRLNLQDIKFQPVDLVALTRETLSSLEMQVASTGGRVEVMRVTEPSGAIGAPEQTGPIVKADPLQMQRLLQNLVGNALKFHRPGQSPSVKVWLVERGDDSVQIRVEDDGIGFDESQIDRLFQPFQRLVGRSEYDGAGMGLAICRRIVERHGGKITAQAREGGGATFEITLPRGASHTSV